MSSIFFGRVLAFCLYSQGVVMLHSEQCSVGKRGEWSKHVTRLENGKPGRVRLVACSNMYGRIWRLGIMIDVDYMYGIYGHGPWFPPLYQELPWSCSLVLSVGPSGFDLKISKVKADHENDHHYIIWLVVGTCFIFPCIGNKYSRLTNIFQRGWNHQADVVKP